jgi:hypothetical protein
MSVEQLEQRVQELSDQERVKFVTWLDDHRHELLAASAAQETEVLRRLAEVERDPSLLRSFEEADFQQMVQQMTHARAQKTSAGPR